MNIVNPNSLRPYHTTLGPAAVGMLASSRQVNSLWMCHAAPASNIPSSKLVTETESMESVEDVGSAVRRRLLEGRLDSLPTIQSRVVRIFICSCFAGN